MHLLLLSKLVFSQNLNKGTCLHFVIFVICAVDDVLDLGFVDNLLSEGVVLVLLPRHETNLRRRQKSSSLKDDDQHLVEAGLLAIDVFLAQAQRNA